MVKRRGDQYFKPGKEAFILSNPKRCIMFLQKNYKKDPRWNPKRL